MENIPIINRTTNNKLRTYPVAAFNYVIALVVIAWCTVSSGDVLEGDSPPFSVRGFGTLGVTYSDRDDADFVPNARHPKGAGYSNTWTASTDSKIGLQFDARFNSQFSAVVQAVSQYQHDGSYTPAIEWANLAYQVTPDFDVRVGRFVAPTFMYSESRLVGYAHTWIRPPIEVYSALSVTNKDGLDIHYRFPIDSFINTFQVSYGETVNDLASDIEASIDNYLDVHYTVDYGFSALHLSYTSLDSELEGGAVDQFKLALQQLGNSLPGASGRQAIKIADHAFSSRYSIASIGARIDPGNWLLLAEWARVSNSNDVSDIDSSHWYITGGYRLGLFTPYATYAKTRMDDVSTEPIPTSGLPPPVSGFVEGVNTALEDLVVRAQENISMGVRWDFHPSMDLKLQYNHVRTRSGTPGRLTNLQAGFEPGDSVNLFSIAVDFVF